MNHDKFSKAYILALCRKAAKLTGFSVEGDTVPTLIGHLRARCITVCCAGTGCIGIRPRTTQTRFVF